MGTGGNNVPILTENIPSEDKCLVGGYSNLVLNDQGGSVMDVSVGKTGTLRASMGGHQPIVTMENIPSETYTIPHDERSMCCQPGMSDTLTHYVHYVAYSMGHDERSSQFEENKTDPLTASDYKQPPVVAQPMSTTGGQSAYCIGDGQMNQPMMTDKVGALNCMHNGGQKIMQKLVTENKQLEVCAPTMDGDSTDKM